MTFRAARALGPYYKVQVWDARSLAWIDIQQAHPTPAAAETAYPPGRRCRTMAVGLADRRPLPGSERAMPGAALACAARRYRAKEPPRPCGAPAGWEVLPTPGDRRPDPTPLCYPCATKAALYRAANIRRIDPATGGIPCRDPI